MESPVLRNRAGCGLWRWIFRGSPVNHFFVFSISQDVNMRPSTIISAESALITMLSVSVCCTAPAAVAARIVTVSFMFLMSYRPAFLGPGGAAVFTGFPRRSRWIPPVLYPPREIFFTVRNMAVLNKTGRFESRQASGALLHSRPLKARG